MSCPPFQNSTSSVSLPPNPYERRLEVVSLEELSKISVDFEFEFFDLTKDSDMCEIQKLIIHEMCTDVIVTICEKVFRCHLLLLQCYSDYFIDCSAGTVIELLPEFVTPQSFCLIYDWMKQIEITPCREELVDLFKAAHYLQIVALLSEISYFFKQTKIFNETNAWHLYLEAREKDAKILRDIMLTRISKSFMSFVATKEFLEMSAEDLYYMINMNFVAVNSEMEIFMCIIRWLDFDWYDRYDDTKRLMSCVRFELMPIWFLTNLKTKERAQIIRNVLSIPYVNQLIQRAITKTLTASYLERDNSLDITSEPSQVKERPWVMDKACCHHHAYGCPNWIYLTYKAFNRHIKDIIKIGASYHICLQYMADMCIPNCCLDADAFCSFV